MIFSKVSELVPDRPGINIPGLILYFLTCLWCFHIYTQILLIHKNKEILPFVTTWMYLEVIVRS